jgi:hypothetical protein
LAAAAASAAGTVNVTFVDSDKFFDAGNTKWDVPDNLKSLERHLQTLGERYLADGQVLDISVLDVDLAGWMLPDRRNAPELRRVAKGTADWPTIKLRYTLQAGGTPLKSGDEAVTDLDYIRNVVKYSTREPLYREKQMLDNWFRARFTSEH